MSEYLFQDYAEKLCRGVCIDPEIPLPYFANSAVDLADPDQQAYLVRQLEILETEILFIDSGRAASSVDENSSAEVRQFVRGFVLETLRNEHGISTVILSHTAKNGNGPRGSGEWSAAADGLWEFHSEDSSDIVEIRGRGRHPSFELTFEFESDDDSAAVRELDSVAAGRRSLMSPERVAAALDALRARNGAALTANGMLAELKEVGVGIRKARVGEFLKRLEQEHAEVSSRTKQFGDAVVATYYMVPRPREPP